MHRFALTIPPMLALTPLLLLTQRLDSAFDGPYAPDLWTFSPGPGGFILKFTSDELGLVGGDIGPAGDADVNILVAATGIWSFHWSFGGINTSSLFDNAYYLINGEEFFISGSNPFGLQHGDVEVLVQQGDMIGFRVTTVDGLFGPGLLTITNFSAPVPGPSAIAFLPLVALQVLSRRQVR